MPLIGFHRMTQGVWRGIIGSDIQVGGGTPPPPPVTTPAYVVSVGPQTATSGHTYVTLPAHQTGDILIAFVQSSNEAIALNIANGFVEKLFLANQAAQGTGTAATAGSVRLAVFWARATSNAMPNPRIADPGDHAECFAIAVRGAPSTGDPFDVVFGNLATPAANAITIPGVTTLLDKDLLLAVVAHARDTSVIPQVQSWATPGTLSNFAIVADLSTVSGTGGGIAVASSVAPTAGATGNFTAAFVAAATSLQSRAMLAIKPTAGSAPPPASAFRTFVGFFGNPSGNWGSQPVPDDVHSDVNGATWVTATTGNIAKLTAQGGCGIMKIAGSGSAAVQDPVTKRFVPQMFKDNFDTAATSLEAVSGGLTTLRDAVRNGVMRGLLVLDDYTAASTQNFSRAVTYEELEDICQYVKQRWPWMPCIARGRNLYNKATATLNGVIRQYQYLDCGWAQYRPRVDGDPAAYFAQEVSDGSLCGLGTMGGINYLRQGSGALPWGCYDDGVAGKCAASPTEITTSGLAALANARIVGYTAWAYDSGGTLGSTYTLRSDIQAAFQTIYNASVGRLDGSINIRGDLVAA